MKRAYLIAEAGVNHGGDFGTAFQMVREAARSGCDAIKFQSYRPDDLVTAAAPTYWEQEGTQRDALAQTKPLSRSEFKILASFAKGYDIDFIVTPFHTDDVPFFAGICHALKVASGDITNVPLLEAVAVAATRIVVSTGGATAAEIQRARLILDGATFLHCVLSYPTATSDANLARITELGLNGYSDHTVPPDSHTVIQAAYTLGASVIEKHFTLDKTLPGSDHYHSFNPGDFRKLRTDLDLIAAATEYRGETQPCEDPGRAGARRSWTTTVDIPAGTTITQDMVTLMRPGTGLQP